jgi:hypothetical protein
VTAYDPLTDDEMAELIENPMLVHLYDAHRLVAALATIAALRAAPLDVERLYRVIADVAWDEATSPVGDPMDGVEMHDLGVLARAIAREYNAAILGTDMAFAPLSTIAALRAALDTALETAQDGR